MAREQLILATAVGISLGVVTGLPLGVVNVAIVEAAVRRGARSAAGIGVGGALADGVHAAIAFGGVAHALAGRPQVAAAAYLVCGVVLLLYAVWLLRSRPPSTPRRPSSDAGGGLGAGVLTGLGLTLPNPAALGAWIAVAAAVAPNASLAEAGATGLGVAAGSAAWFVTLARLAARGSISTTTPRRWLTRAVAIVIGGVGIAALVRAALT